ncbi:RCC1 domain-containing protein [Silvanigrella sp.]|jgi:hypothetical protein|uniref:RCC1 domain-containing protein n=1 Tax=Silvanigrella sp. TaxID=2024976 RepID=UPI0037C75F59
MLGANTNGQLGNGTTVASTTAVSVILGGTAVSFMSQNNDSCAIISSGVLKCWGQDFATTPTAVSLSSTPNVLGGGTSNSPFLGCINLSSGTAQCFGSTTNTYGELGNGTNSAPANAVTGYTVINASSNQPLSGISMIGSGGARVSGTVENFACAVADDFANVYCWGRNAHGNLGNGTTTDTNKATKVTKTWPNSNIIDIAVSDGRACILLKNSDVWCWGRVLQ